MGSGDFDRIIFNEIRARAHFILLISSGSLEGCANEGDWGLGEIQEAVRLERNIVPVIEEGADFTHDRSYALALTAQPPRPERVFGKGRKRPSAPTPLPKERGEKRYRWR
jgi:hypothetical protein